MTHLAENLPATAAKHPDQAALRRGGSTLTYARFDDLPTGATGTIRKRAIDRTGVQA